MERMTYEDLLNKPELGSLMRRLFACVATVALAGCAASYGEGSLVPVPASLTPRAGESLAMVVPARGVQIYECRAAKGEPAALEWAFVGPEADLYDTGGNRIGRHYGGPHWEAADGSRVVGKVRERTDAPRAGDIPWLLLGAESVGPDGAFSRVTSIQRVATVGGAAPSGGCTKAGVQARVAYTADYYFFSPGAR